MPIDENAIRRRFEELRENPPECFTEEEVKSSAFKATRVLRLLALLNSSRTVPSPHL